MLETVTIQNFRSLKDVTLKLQKVNLLIGPNNSGKSNFLKALATMKEFYNRRIQPLTFDFERVFHKQLFKNTFTRKYPIKFSLKWENMHYANANNALYQLELIGFNEEKGNELIYSEGFGISTKEISNEFRLLDLDAVLKSFDKFFAVYRFEKPLYSNNSAFSPLLEYYKNDNRFDNMLLLFSNGTFTPSNWNWSDGYFLNKLVDSNAYLAFDLEELFQTVKIYQPNPTLISSRNTLLFDKHVNEDCSNLVAFLDNMRDQHEDVWQAMQKDLNKCIPEFVGINFEKVNVNGKNDSIGKKFGLRDKFGKIYWSGELSEGTIYFLALLAIIHQPNAPKLILLEEPEKGIHPRRIAEVMDLIFRLANEKDIQIIITSHSTQVVDQFQDIPESVFVFESKEGETKVKNLLTDIIEPDNKSAEEKDYPKLDFSKHSLGEHWAIGFFGGVPAK